MDASTYGSYFPSLSGKQCVVYKSVVEAGVEDFDRWADMACEKHNHCAFNLVGAPSSKRVYSGLKLDEAGLKMKSRGGNGFGCVCIPERHITKGDEQLNMIRKIEFGAEWFITQGIFSSAPVSKLLNEYGDICRQKGITPKKVILTFAPCGRKKTMDFIKWLGIIVPEHKERRILDAEVPVRESITLLREILLNILQQTGNSGVPIGINVESLSIFKDEIDGAHDLFRILQATMLNSQGSPWAIRWFPVAEAKLYTSAKLSVDDLIVDLDKVQPKLLEDLDSSKAITRSNIHTSLDPNITIQFATIGFVGILGIVIGRLSAQQ
jgi:hypothetical protein|mmetsp:Transcript_17947/g.17265  ORF Transcript_17947/g.17265 Transcript_17947/m.17265 type:complete len:323 (-) Transcript_17947:8-976(-)